LKAPNPRKHKIGEGRFNHHGQSVLYLAESKEGAAIEVVKPKESVAWVQRFKVSKLVDVLDLTTTESLMSNELPVVAVGLIHSGALDHPKRDGSWVPEYFVPRYIADCARATGFVAVKFNASRHYEKNLVLFNPKRSTIRAIGQPKLFRIRKKHPGLPIKPVTIDLDF
jgi:hypothetical protein